MNEAKENVKKYESFKIFGLIVGILATALGSKLLTVEDRSSFGGFIFICGIAVLGSALLCRQVAKEYTKEVEQEVGQLDKHLSETQQLLKKLYELDYIFPKYRNFVAICSIYEYFVSGRCTEYEGLKIYRIDQWVNDRAVHQKFDAVTYYTCIYAMHLLISGLIN